jgi:hypothetical protein
LVTNILSPFALLKNENIQLIKLQMKKVQVKMPDEVVRQQGA